MIPLLALGLPSSCGTSQSERFLEVLHSFNALANSAVLDQADLKSSEKPDGNAISRRARRAMESEDCTKVFEKDHITIEGEKCALKQRYMTSEKDGVREGTLKLELVGENLIHVSDVTGFDLSFKETPAGEHGLIGRVEATLRTQRFGEIQMTVTRRANGTVSVRMESPEVKGELSAAFGESKKINRIMLSGKDISEGEYRAQVREKNIFTGEI